MMNKFKDAINKLFGKSSDYDKFQFKIVELTEVQRSYKPKPLGWQALKDIGFQVVDGKYKNVVARLNNVVEMPSEESDSGGNVRVQFDYTIVDAGKIGIDLEVFNDDNSDECLNFIPYARAMFQKFVNESLAHALKEPESRNE